MGIRPVTNGPGSPSSTSGDDTPGWKLQAQIAKEVQGLAVSGFNALPAAKALFLEFVSSGGGWLAPLAEAAPITAADGPQRPAAIIAFTATGLEKLGLPLEDLASFSLPFVQGMQQFDRQHRLGDYKSEVRAGKKPVWSANTDEQARTPDQVTATTVHAILILYEKGKGALTEHTAKITSLLQEQGVSIVREMELDLRLDARGIPREHFGFADGVSQPIPYGPGTAGPDGDEFPCDPLHGVPLGEILLGYVNAHGEIPPGPVVAGSTRVGGSRQSSRHADRLPLIKDSAGLHDLGLNGAYLVVRELTQDVPAFWNSLDREAAALKASAGGASSKVTAEWLAARIVGRDTDGNLLGPEGPLPPKGADPSNDVLFFKDDRFGFGCPLGSHARRANPRDGLAFEAAGCPDVLRAANNHRLLRRGRKFGPSIDDLRTPDDADRGLLFICLNTDLERQFEFVQQNWLFNPNFATLFKEVDPLVGPTGPMTLPRQPLRHKIVVDTYVKFVGGDYFFMPSLSALSYLQTLTPSPDPGPPDGAKP